MERKLSPEEKEIIKRMIDSDQPIPYDLLARLFPDGDGTVGDREQQFRERITRLNGMHWTAIAIPVTACPLKAAQVAWPWRREIWHVHFACANMLDRAYRSYTTGWYADTGRWNTISRILLRYGFLVGALALHNGLEDRIAQLANAFLKKPFDEEKVSFGKLFDKANVGLSKTWQKAADVKESAQHEKIHALANEVKHRWTGEFIPHLPKPQELQKQLEKCGFIGYGLVFAGGSFLQPDWRPDDPPDMQNREGRITEQNHKAMANLDAICEAVQKSLNMLTELAVCLDAEIDWPSHGLQLPPGKVST